MCCKKDDNGRWYFEEQTVKNTIELVRYLMQLHGITIDNIVRHYDVTRKVCPEPYVRDEEAWADFKRRLIVKEIDNVKDALDFLEKKGRLSSRSYWEKVIECVRNEEFIFIKWAKDVQALGE